MDETIKISNDSYRIRKAGIPTVWSGKIYKEAFACQKLPSPDYVPIERYGCSEKTVRRISASWGQKAAESFCSL